MSKAKQDPQLTQTELASLVAEQAAAIEGASDKRPDILTPKHRTEYVEDKGLPPNITPLPPVVGDALTIFKHRETGYYYQFNTAFLGDANFTPVVVARDKLPASFAG